MWQQLCVWAVSIFFSPSEAPLLSYTGASRDGAHPEEPTLEEPCVSVVCYHMNAVGVTKSQTQKGTSPKPGQHIMTRKPGTGHLKTCSHQSAYIQIKPQYWAKVLISLYSGQRGSQE